MLTSSKSLACCVCDGNSSFYKNVDGFDLLRCQGCGLIYMKEVATKAINFLEEVTAQENQESLSIGDIQNISLSINEFLILSLMKDIRELKLIYL